MGRVQFFLAFACFASSMFNRVFDPLVPVLARELATSPDRVALLSTAFALPFGALQLIFGPLGDRIGRALVIRGCMLVITASGFASALAWGYDSLLVTRIVAGAASAGIFPATIALIGDRVPLEQRQGILSRMLGATIAGTLAGAIGAGLLVETLSWRGVLAVCAAFSAVGTAAILAVLPSERQRVAPAGVGLLMGFRRVFDNWKAPVCYTAVFGEGLFIFGLIPFVALLLEQRGEGGPAIAGLVLAGFPAGGILYSAVAPRLLTILGTGGMMAGGGFVACASLAVVAFGVPWQVEAGVFVMLGFGFYLLHNSMQVQATELSHQFRGSAVAMHGCSFMTGSAIGPIAYGAGLNAFGPTPTLFVAALGIAVVGTACGILLHPRRQDA